MNAALLRRATHGVRAAATATHQPLRGSWSKGSIAQRATRSTVTCRYHATEHGGSSVLAGQHGSSTGRVSVDPQRSAIAVELQAGERVDIPLLYLRDSCPCPVCRHKDTHQRLLDTFSLPTKPEVRTASVTTDGLAVVWNDGDHQSIYTWNQLSNLLSTRKSVDSTTPDLDGEVFRYRLWDASIAASPPTVSYDEIMNSDEGVRQWTKLIRTHGISMIEGCPATPEATEKLLERLSFVRSTHYGGFWDFTSDLRSKDTAYTSLALEAHTDTNYFKDPAGLQMFHMLSHTDGNGGESLFVDGYKAAQVLKARSPASYEILRKHKLLYECKGNDDVMLHAVWPVLPAAPVPEEGDPIAPHDPLLPIRWNNSDRASAQMPSAAATEEWYEAAREFDRVLKDPANEFWIKLKPGTPVIFDNYRVLHGRAAFTGKRRMCGGYINAQDFLSRWKTSNFSRETLFEQSPQQFDGYSSL